MKKITRGVRFEPLLIARCEAKASAEQLSFSEWIRSIARRECGMKASVGRNGGHK